MAAIVATTEVDRSAEEVFAYATDPTRFSQWQRGVVDGRMDHAGAPAVGARCLTTRRIGVAHRPATSRLAYIDPPRAWGVRGIDGPIRAVVDLTIEPLSDGRSRLTIAVDFKGHGIGKILVPLARHPQPGPGRPTADTPGRRPQDRADRPGALPRP